MKFRYYITDTIDGRVVGTNDPVVAQEYSVSAEHFVVDAKLGMWLIADNIEAIQDIEE